MKTITIEKTGGNKEIDHEEIKLMAWFAAGIWVEIHLVPGERIIVDWRRPDEEGWSHDGMTIERDECEPHIFRMACISEGSDCDGYIRHVTDWVWRIGDPCEHLNGVRIPDWIKEEHMADYF